MNKLERKSKNKTVEKSYKKLLLKNMNAQGIVWSHKSIPIFACIKKEKEKKQLGGGRGTN